MATTSWHNRYSRLDLPRVWGASRRARARRHRAVRDGEFVALLPDAEVAADVEHAEHVEHAVPVVAGRDGGRPELVHEGCLLYTSDAADERSSVDLGGRR